ncbi:trafficking protein particle complex subunit 12 [Rhodamnia argentea]|uniref:Trafficking protein particle complex subunit 12 n=1 Tax=Rhodamnia argentea TaxID=178133 RepID=A0A8B8PK13_9MYRT|nr:trafficking protein particle complex subunit 12 [Rhodamnia argentea]
MEEAPNSPPALDDPLTNPSSSFSSLDDLAYDLSSLEDLANRGSWRSLIDKVARARSLSLLRHPHDHLAYLSYNALALSKLRRFTDASAELDSLQDLDSSEYRYESYPQIYPGRSGSMVPFCLRWLNCVIPIKLGSRQEGLDRFYALLDFVRGKLEERRIKGLSEEDESVRAWRRREVSVMNSIVGNHLSYKEFSVCLDLIRDMFRRGYSEDPVLVSRLGYIQMQIGDLEGAKSSFKQIEGMASEGKDRGSLSEVELKNLVNRNKALVYLVGKDYVSAVREYEECIERDDSDVVAINNKALCLMYLRDLSDSIKVLENALERVPTVALNESLVVNLCSMYELAYVNHADIKKTLSNWIARVAPDDFDSSCTRI